MRERVFFMTYRNAQAWYIAYGVLCAALFCAPSLHAYDVFDSLDDAALPIGERLLKIIDDEESKASRLENLDIDKSTPRVAVPLGRTLLVGLHGRNWVLDARRSDIAQANKSDIIWQGLQESQGRSIFVFTRKALGTNKLVFSRSDNATADQFWYFLSVDWVDDSADKSALASSASHAPRTLLSDSHATVMMVAHDDVGENVVDLFSSDTLKATQSEAPMSDAVESSEVANISIPAVPHDMQNKDAETKPVPIEDRTQEAGVDDESSETQTASSELDPYNASLQKLHAFLKVGNYAEAQEAIAQHKNDLELKDAVPRFLFDSAHYLETMHEREGVRSIQNIEKAIMFYERIVNEYPLSVFYANALERCEFLQKKYVFIR